MLGNSGQRDLRACGVHAVPGRRRGLYRRPVVPSAARGRAQPVLAAEIETELPARLRHIEFMARVSAVAPIVEAVPHAGPEGDSLRIGLARLDRDTARIARHRKRPRKHRPCAIDPDPRPRHVRLDQGMRLLAAACGEFDQEPQVPGQGNPDGIRGHPGSGRQVREVPLCKLARSPRARALSQGVALGTGERGTVLATNQGRVYGLQRLAGPRP